VHPDKAVYRDLISRTNRRGVTGGKMTTPERWLSGHVLLYHWNIKGSELYRYLRKGLQAYNDKGIPVINPDVLPRKKKSREQIIESIRAGIERKENIARCDMPVRESGASAFIPPAEDEIQERAQREFETQKRTPVYPLTPHVINPFRTYTDAYKMRSAIHETLNYLFSVEAVNKFAKEKGLASISEEISIDDFIKKARRAPKTRSTPRQLTPCQRHKIACGELAAVLWKENPEMTIPQLQARDEIKNACEGKKYHRKTFQRWVTKFNPYREPGTRPKKVDF